MAKLNSRQELKDYILRKLGHPVVQINISDAQLEDRIDDAEEFMYEYNYNLMEKKYLPIKITQEDIDNNYITVPEELLSVSRILPIRNPNLTASNFLFDIQYHLTANDLLNTVGTGDVSQYYITRQHIATITDIFNAKAQHEFRRYTGKLYFEFDGEQRLGVDDFIVLECFIPITGTAFYNDRIFRNYATLLAKRQWGENLSKFGNMQLPGGLILNGERIYKEAQDEITKMELDPIFQYSEPDEPFTF